MSLRDSSNSEMFVSEFQEDSEDNVLECVVLKADISALMCVKRPVRQVQKISSAVMKKATINQLSLIRDMLYQAACICSI